MASVVNKYYSLGSGNWARLVLRITQISQSIANNTSQVKVQLIWQKLQSDGNLISIGAREDTKITADGTTVTKTAPDLTTTSAEKVIVEHTFTVSHASTGKKTASVSVSYPMQATIQGKYHGTVSISSSIELDDIPRKSTLKSFSFSPLEKSTGQYFKIDLTRASTSFTHDIELRDGSTVIHSWTGVGVPSTLWIPYDKINQMLNSMPKVTSKTFTLRVQTKSGNANIGDPISVNSTVTIHADVKPSIATLGISDTNSVARGLGVGFIQGVSKLRGTATGVSPGYGATIKSRSWSLDGQVKSNESDTGPTFNPSNKTSGLQMQLVVTDTRGRTATFRTGTVSQTAYSRPTINSFTVRRYDSNNPEKLNFNLSATRTTLGGGNTLRYRILRRPLNGTQVTHKAWTSPAASNINLSATTMADLTSTGDYEMAAQVEDLFTSTIRTFDLKGTQHLWRKVTRGRKAEYFLSEGMFLNGALKVRSNAEVFGMYGQTHAYMGLYANGTSRTAFLGQASPDNKNLYISNETSGADILLATSGSGKIRANGEEILTFPPTNDNVNFNTFTEPGFHYFSGVTNGPTGSSSAGWYAIIIKASAGHVVQFTLRTSTALSDPFYIRRGTKSGSSISWGPWGQIALGAV